MCRARTELQISEKPKNHDYFSCCDKLDVVCDQSSVIVNASVKVNTLPELPLTSGSQSES